MSGWWEVGAQIVNNNKIPPNLNFLTDTLTVRNSDRLKHISLGLFQPCQVLPRSLKVLSELLATSMEPYMNTKCDFKRDFNISSPYFFQWFKAGVVGFTISLTLLVVHKRCRNVLIYCTFPLQQQNLQYMSVHTVGLNHCSDWERHTALSCFQSHALCSSHYTAFSCVKWVPEATTNPKQSCNVGCSDMRYNFSPRQQASSVCQGMLSLPTGRKLYAAINWWMNFFTCPLEMIVWLWRFPIEF